MTDTITLPGDVVWTGTLGVFVVPGDRRGGSLHPMGAYSRSVGRAALNETTFVAPQQWAQYDRKCETCRTKPTLVSVADDYGRHQRWGRCPDCRDGHQLRTVRWPCRNAGCDGVTFAVTDMDNDTGEIVTYRMPCKADHERSATLQVVPVVAFGDWEITARPVPVLTVDDFGQCVLMLREDGPDGAYGEQITLDPPPTPGRDFAVIVRLETP